MVDFGHRWRDGECSSNPCPWCEFKSRLCDEIAEARDKPEHVWNKVVGDLQDRLFDAVWALHRVRREGFTTEHDLIANEFEAGERLVSVFHALDGFRSQFGIDLNDEEEET
jgi:hypothetical protein